MTTNNEWVDLLTKVVVDGTLVDESKYAKNPERSTKKRIQFKLSKSKKIVSLITLLNKMGISYTFAEATKSPTNKLQPYVVRIYGQDARNIFQMLSGQKSFPLEWAQFDFTRTRLFLQYLEKTGGKRVHNRLIWGSDDEQSLAVVKEMLGNNKIAFTESVLPSGFNKEKMIPVLSIPAPLHQKTKNQSQPPRMGS